MKLKYYNNMKLTEKMSIASALIIILFIAALVAVGAVDFYVASFAKDKIFYNIQKVPPKKAALILGTVKKYQARPNLYYEFRLNAAYDLWKYGKVNAIIVSGDNSKKHYNEPFCMKNDLVKRGIPPEYITEDFAGFRTLDSVVRANKIFSLEDYIIVSQDWHCQRALFLCHKMNQKAVAYCAKDVRGTKYYKARLRELLARNKALLDIIFNVKPKYLGNKETVNYRNNQPES
jgi:SanA protein